MTPNEHDDPAKSDELTTTELYPFAPVTPGRRRSTTRCRTSRDGAAAGLAGAPRPRLPGDAEPAAARCRARPPGASNAGRRQAPEPPRGPSARSWPLPPGPLPRPPFQPSPSPRMPSRPASPATAPQPPQAAEAPRQVWSADPYAPPRAPAAAPPLHGPSVPWSQVRAAADYEAAGENGHAAVATARDAGGLPRPASAATPEPPPPRAAATQRNSRSGPPRRRSRPTCCCPAGGRRRTAAGGRRCTASPEGSSASASRPRACGAATWLAGSGPR